MMRRSLPQTFLLAGRSTGPARCLILAITAAALATACREYHPQPKPPVATGGTGGSTGGSGGSGTTGGRGGSTGGTGGAGGSVSDAPADLGDARDGPGADTADALACGSPGKACCPGNHCLNSGCCVKNVCSGLGEPCLTGASCILSSCGGCGRLDQNCCVDRQCVASFTICDQLQKCIRCGGLNEPCCADGYCGEGRVCANGRCSLPGTMPPPADASPG
jgi:hypothetical protein